MTATASIEAISRELALPLDDIIGDATSVLDRYAGPQYAGLKALLDDRPELFSR